MELVNKMFVDNIRGIKLERLGGVMLWSSTKFIVELLEVFE